MTFNISINDGCDGKTKDLNWEDIVTLQLTIGGAASVKKSKEVKFSNGDVLKIEVIGGDEKII